MKNTLFNLLKAIDFPTHKVENNDLIQVKRLDIIDEILNLVGDLPEYMKGSYRYVSFLEYREKLDVMKPKYCDLSAGYNFDTSLRNLLKDLDKIFSGLMCAFNSIILLKRIKSCEGGYLDQHLRLYKGPHAIEQILVKNHKSIIKLFVNTLSNSDDKDIVMAYWIKQIDAFEISYIETENSIDIKFRTFYYQQQGPCESFIQFLSLIGFNGSVEYKKLPGSFAYSRDLAYITLNFHEYLL